MHGHDLKPHDQDDGADHCPVAEQTDGEQRLPIRTRPQRLKYLHDGQHGEHQRLPRAAWLGLVIGKADAHCHHADEETGPHHLCKQPIAEDPRLR